MNNCIERDTVNETKLDYIPQIEDEIKELEETSSIFCYAQQPESQLKTSELFDLMCDFNKWQEAIYKADKKGMKLSLIGQLCDPTQREMILKAILGELYLIAPPNEEKQPKDEPGEFRLVYANQPLDRIILSLINDCLCEVFSDMVHPMCKSYQKGIGTQKVVREVSSRVVELGKTKKRIGWKLDLKKYFDTVNIETIDKIFDELERRLGFEHNTEPVINLLRKYYHQDAYIDLSGKLQKKYQGLKQGCSVASFLANVCLYELDEYMSNKYEIYYRYSDDILVLDKNTDKVVDDINRIIKKYGVSLNPKKVEPLYADKWFKFLGFNIRGELITLSKRRVKDFEHEIKMRSIKLKKCSSEKARKNIIRYLYEGEFCWATACLGTINVTSDIQELNKYVMDCIKACGTGRKSLGGLGVSFEYSDKTILRGKGRHVKQNRNKIGKIHSYYSILCMKNILKFSKQVFDSIVKEMLR